MMGNGVQKFQQRQRIPKGFVVLCGILGAIGLLSHSVASAAGTPAAESRIAIINVSRVFENYSKVSKVQQRVDAQYDPDLKVLQSKSADLIKRQKALQEMSEQSDQQGERVFDLIQGVRKETFLFEREMERYNANIQKAYTKAMQEVLSDIRIAISTHAESNGFLLVLRAPSSDDPDVDPKAKDNPAAGDDKTVLARLAPKSVSEIVERFNRNPVLFGSTTKDITEEVLAKLNRDYEKQKN